MKKWTLFLLPVAAALGISMGCSNESAAHSTLRSHGFTKIQTTGYGGPFSCGEGDWSTTGFTATNSRGQRVRGVVCCGLVFKNCTVRF